CAQGTENWQKTKTAKLVEAAIRITGDERFQLELIVVVEAARDIGDLLGQQSVGADDPVPLGVRERGVDDQKMIAEEVEAVRIALLQRFQCPGLRSHLPVEDLEADGLSRGDLIRITRQAHLKRTDLAEDGVAA